MEKSQLENLIMSFAPVDDLATAFRRDHLEKDATKSLTEGRKAGDVLAEEGESEVVDVVEVVLGDVNAVHVHEDVADHDHGRVVLVPRLHELSQKVAVRFKHVQ